MLIVELGFGECPGRPLVALSGELDTLAAAAAMASAGPGRQVVVGRENLVSICPGSRVTLPGRRAAGLVAWLRSAWWGR